MKVSPDQLTPQFTDANVAQALAESVGNGFLLSTIVGSSIVGYSLAGGNGEIAILGSSISTGAVLRVLILTLGPVSGGHLGPATTFAFRERREIAAPEAPDYAISRVAGGIIGVPTAYAMFTASIFQLSSRSFGGQTIYLSETIAAFELVFGILVGSGYRPPVVRFLVGMYILAAHWIFPSGLANPAAAVALPFGVHSSGIAISSAPALFVCQLGGPAVAVLVARALDFQNSDTGTAGKRAH